MTDKPKFSFRAHSVEPNDKSGRATWEYVVHDRGEWKPAATFADFDSFGHACQIDSIIKAAYERGEAAGYAQCEERVLAALKGQP